MQSSATQVRSSTLPSRDKAMTRILQAVKTWKERQLSVTMQWPGKCTRCTEVATRRQHTEVDLAAKTTSPQTFQKQKNAKKEQHGNAKTQTRKKKTKTSKTKHYGRSKHRSKRRQNKHTNRRAATHSSATTHEGSRTTAHSCCEPTERAAYRVAGLL